jgi:hypothetical protein
VPYLAEFLLFLLPFAAFALWRRYNPAVEPDRRLVLAALAGVGLMLAGAVWYGQAISMRPHAVYMPATLGPDGRVQPYRAGPPP